MENSEKSSKAYLQYGVMYGVIMILLFVVVYAMGINPAENRLVGISNSVLGNLILPVLFIYLGCALFKKNNTGFISMPECLKVGVSIAFVAALIFAAFNTAFNLLVPEYAEELFKQTRSIMLEQNPNMTSDQVDTAMSLTKKLSSPVFSIPLILLGFSFLGLIYSLIVGLIVKNTNPQGY